MGGVWAARRMPTVELHEDILPQAHDVIRETDSRLWVHEVCDAAIRDVGGETLPGRILTLVRGGLSPAEATRENGISRQTCHKAMTKRIRSAVANYV